QAAADREEFEEAARLRDRIFKIERTLEKQRVTQTASTEQDVIGLARQVPAQGTAVDLQMLFVRGGLLIGRKDFFWPKAADASDEELVRSAIEQFYNKEGLPVRRLHGGLGGQASQEIGLPQVPHQDRRRRQRFRQHPGGGHSALW